MKPVTSLIAAGAAALIATAAAQQGQQGQQGQAPEQQEQEGIPASPHQEQALRDVGSDLFRRLDQNHDGLISREEAQSESSLSASWNEYDENGDQSLDQQEFAAYDASTASETEGEEVEVAEGGPTVEGLPSTTHQQQALRTELVELLDEDGDGAISRNEAQGESQLIEDWDQLDRNSDGKLDAGELGHGEE